MADVKTAEKQENKDHVYAIVHKDNTGREGAARVHARTPSSKRLEPASRACSAVEPVNSSSSADIDPANHSDERPYSVELVNYSQEALVGDEKKDYLYAVVDKANKKKRSPQVIIMELLFCLVTCAFPCFFLIQAFGNIDQRFLLSLDLSVTTIISCSLKNNSKSHKGYLSKN